MPGISRDNPKGCRRGPQLAYLVDFDEPDTFGGVGSGNLGGVHTGRQRHGIAASGAPLVSVNAPTLDMVAAAAISTPALTEEGPRVELEDQP